MKLLTIIAPTLMLAVTAKAHAIFPSICTSEPPLLAVVVTSTFTGTRAVVGGPAVTDAATATAIPILTVTVTTS